MRKHSTKKQEPEETSENEYEHELRLLLDDQGDDHDTFNPRTGEDPGLLPMTEDPLERRQKRNTM